MDHEPVERIKARRFRVGVQDTFRPLKIEIGML